MAVNYSDFQRLPWYYQALIVVGVSGVILGGFWYQFLRPMEANLVAQNAQLTQLNQDVAAAVARQMELAEIRAEAERLGEQLDALKTILPLERETDQILRQVQQAATDSSLRILRVSPRATVDNDFYSEWPIDMQVEATYHNMGQYLDRIRELERIVNITGLQMNAAGDGVTSSVSVTYTATTFVYREEEPPPGN
jgi:type IV pilus assembly protein PilO